MEYYLRMSYDLTEDERVQLNDLLDKCEPGHLPPEIFEKVGRICVYSAVELIPLRRSEGGIEVLLLRRPADDITWPNMLHTPGTILRPDDTSLESALRRLITSELPSILLSPPEFIGVHMVQTRRGTGLTIEFIAEVTGAADMGEFFNIDSLPAEIVAHQIPMIRRAANYHTGRAQAAPALTTI